MTKNKVKNGNLRGTEAKKIANVVRQVVGTKKKKKTRSKMTGNAFGSIAQLDAPLAQGTIMVGRKLVVKPTKNGVALSGRYVSDKIVLTNSPAQANFMILSPLHMATSDVSLMCRSWEKFRFKGIKITLVSSNAASTEGEFILNYHKDVGALLWNPNANSFFSQIGSDENTIFGNCWANLTLVPQIDTREKYVDAFNIPDIEDCNSGMVTVYGTITGTSLGYVVIDYEMDFLNFKYNPRNLFLGSNLGSSSTITVADTAAVNVAFSPFAWDVTVGTVTIGDVYIASLDGVTAANYGVGSTAANYALVFRGPTGTQNLSMVDCMLIYLVAVSNTQVVPYVRYESAVSGTTGGEMGYQSLTAAKSDFQVRVVQICNTSVVNT